MKRQPFQVIQFSSVTNVKRCYGCGIGFAEKYKHEPNDLILKYYCHRRYKDSNGNFVLSINLQGAYFHLKLDCARKQDPLMDLKDIIVHSEVVGCLSAGHKALLRKKS